MYAYIYTCMYVCISMHILTMYIYIYIYILINKRPTCLVTLKSSDRTKQSVCG